MIDKNWTWAFAAIIALTLTGACRADDKAVAGQAGAATPPRAAGPGGPATAGFRPPESCLKEFTPLRDETARRAKLIKVRPSVALRLARPASWSMSMSWLRRR